GTHFNTDYHDETTHDLGREWAERTETTQAAQARHRLGTADLPGDHSGALRHDQHRQRGRPPHNSAYLLTGGGARAHRVYRMSAVILIADDDEISCQLFAEALEPEGYRMHQVTPAIAFSPACANSLSICCLSTCACPVGRDWR